MANKKRNPWYGRIAALTGVLVLLVAIAIGISIANAGGKDEATVLLDAEAGIQLQLGGGNKVIKAQGLNEAGDKLLAELELENKSIDVAAAQIIESLLENGYLTDKANSVLVSVSGGNAAKLQSSVAAKVEKAMTDASFSGSVMSQTVSADDKLEQLASENGISVGKAQLIACLADPDDSRDFAELAKLSVHELNMILNAGSAKAEVQVSGKPSEAAYIGADAAKQAALEHAGEDAAAQATAVYTEMDCEDGVLCYEVTFRYGSYAYDYKIDAGNGAVLAYDMELVELPSGTQPTVTVPTIPEAGYMSPQDALQYALDHAVAEMDQVSWLDVELDDADESRPHYDCTFVFEGYRYDYEVHAVTGEILSTDIQEAPDRDDPPPTAPVFTQPPAVEYIDQQAALAAALEDAGASKDAVDVIQMVLESGSDGGGYGEAHYEITFEWNGFRYAYHINAVSGDVLTYEVTETEGADGPDQGPEDDIGDDIYDDSDDFVGEDDDEFIDGEFGEGEGGFDDGPADDDYEEDPEGGKYDE